MTHSRYQFSTHSARCSHGCLLHGLVIIRTSTSTLYIVYIRRLSFSPISCHFRPPTVIGLVTVMHMESNKRHTPYGDRSDLLEYPISKLDAYYTAAASSKTRQFLDDAIEGYWRHVERKSLHEETKLVSFDHVSAINEKDLSEDKTAVKAETILNTNKACSLLSLQHDSLLTYASASGHRRSVPKTELR